MDLTTFLSLLVPDGVMVAGKLVHRTDYSIFQHVPVTAHAELARELIAMDASQSNAYFALAAYAQGFHDGPTDPKTGKPKRQLRVRTNVVALKAFWFDIDYKGTLTDIRAAATALKAFCAATRVPFPSMLVSSGNGCHVYWPLARPMPVEAWQKLADALKAAALEQGLDIDPVCTADACRVLRPIGTSNWKDPANPKPVSLIGFNGQTFTPEEMEAALMPWVAAKTRAALQPTVQLDLSAYGELTGGITMARNETPAQFGIIVQHCGVARMMVDTHGKDATEPMWMATLQLLKHCVDGPNYVHGVSDGHPGYSSDETEKKWQYRLQNSSGPTLCSTFEGHEPSICAKCPHRGFIKTPLQVGHADSQPLDGMPAAWRIAPERKGIERLMIDPNTNQKEWVRVLRYIPTNFRVTRSIVTQRYELAFGIEVGGSKEWNLNLPGSVLGNPRKMAEMMADVGVPLKDKEVASFKELMTTWLERLQAARRVADVAEQLGWLVEKTDAGEVISGFSCGPTTFYADGRVRNDVHAARDFVSVSKFYEPKGGLDAWKKVAAFLADQNNPAFTAVLAAAFGTPLLRFTGLSGGILSIVSTASGVGKSSALKCSQAVWGSPTHGVNAVDDTPKSVARKLGFLNNLPAYWDELRGRRTVDDFLTLAFQITQGKEKTRLDSSAQLREVSTWETMLVVASNESIFEAMGRHGGGSDAGMVRTFEITIEPFKHARNKAELQMMFDALNSNYGQAGRVYAQYLATHAPEVEKRVHTMFKNLAQHLNMAAQERFWFAIAAILIVGAELAAKLDLVQTNIRDLTTFLIGNIQRLRGRTVETLTTSEPVELLAAFMGTYQDRALSVDKFPAPKANLKKYIADITGGIPRTDKIIYHVSRDEGLMRVSRSELERWLNFRELPVSNTLTKFRSELGGRELTVKLGVGTKWEMLPTRCFEFNLDKIKLDIDSLQPGGPLPPELDDTKSDAPSNPA